MMRDSITLSEKDVRKQEAKVKPVSSCDQITRFCERTKERTSVFPSCLPGNNLTRSCEMTEVYDAIERK